jgi:hypothetical protein
VKELTSLARVLVSNEAQTIRRGWLEIGRGRYSYDLAAACLAHKREMDEIVKNETMNDDERIQQIRRRLFGTNLPD